MTDPNGWNPPASIWITKGDERFPEDDTWTDSEIEDWPEYVRADLVAAREAAAEAQAIELIAAHLEGLGLKPFWVRSVRRLAEPAAALPQEPKV
jgi:hypothetical protein